MLQASDYSLLTTAYSPLPATTAYCPLPTTTAHCLLLYRRPSVTTTAAVASSSSAASRGRQRRTRRTSTCSWGRAGALPWLLVWLHLLWLHLLWHLDLQLGESRRLTMALSMATLTMATLTMAPRPAAGGEQAPPLTELHLLWLLLWLHSPMLRLHPLRHHPFTPLAHRH